MESEYPPAAKLVPLTISDAVAGYVLTDVGVMLQLLAPKVAGQLRVTVPANPSRAAIEIGPLGAGAACVYFREGSGLGKNEIRIERDGELERRGDCCRSATHHGLDGDRILAGQGSGRHRDTCGHQDGIRSGGVHGGAGRQGTRGVGDADVAGERHALIERSCGGDLKTRWRRGSPTRHGHV